MKNFKDFGLSEPLLKAIQELGYETPSPIQEQAIPMLLGKDTDFLGLAATGTGKTAAFGIPMLERIDPSKRSVQALILCPTRELAIQVSGQINLLGKYKGVKSLPIYGGAGYGDQIYGLKRGAQIVVGTPGRVVDHVEKGTLVLSDLKTLIYDEADEMFSMGFKEDLEFVLQNIPTDQANIWLFSATMSADVRHTADKYLDEPKQVQVNRGAEILPNTVEQFYFMTQESHKPEVLGKLIEAAEDFYGIIFCQTKALVTDLTHHLKTQGYPVDCLHGDMDQNARERTMRAYRERRVTILVATDVACRGLDVKDITHVVNYSLPREMDNYIHRIGRTGRIGKSGIAYNLVTGSHRGLIQRIERLTKVKMREGKIPSRKEIAVKKVSKNLALFAGQDTHARATELLGDDWKKAIAEMSKEEITGRFIALLHPELFSTPLPDREPAPQPQRSQERSNDPKQVSKRYHQDRFDRREQRPPRFDRRDDRDGSRPPKRHDRFAGGSQQKREFPKPRWNKDRKPSQGKWSHA